MNLTTKEIARSLKNSLRAAKLTGDLGHGNVIIRGEATSAIVLWIPHGADEAPYRAIIDPLRPYVYLHRYTDEAVGS